LAHYRTLIFFFLITSCFAQVHPDKNVEKLIRTGVQDIISHKYDIAEENFKLLQTDYPTLPLGDIFIAAVHIAKADDYGEPVENEIIKKHITDAVNKANQLYDNDPDNLWNNYYLALVNGYSAYFEALNNNYISAFANGLSSISYFEKCLKLDSAFYESYLAVGIYKYWKSEKTEYLTWLPFIEDEREEGISKIKYALKHNSYNSYLGINSLLWIYINQKEDSKVVKLAETSLVKYKNCRFFKWVLADAYQRIDKQKAIKIYYELLDFYIKMPGQNHLNEIILEHKIAMLYEETGDNKKALKLCDEILGLNSLNEYAREKLKKRLERVVIMRQRLL